MTHQTNSGETNSAEERMNKVDLLLDQYERELNLPEYNKADHAEVSKYLSINRQDISKLTPDESAEIEIVLKRYAFYIQRFLNKEVSRVNWANDALKIMVADSVDQYSGYSYAERFHKAIKNNAAALKVFTLKNKAQQKVDRLQFIANSVKDIANAFSSLRYVKSNIK